MFQNLDERKHETEEISNVPILGSPSAVKAGAFYDIFLPKKFPEIPNDCLFECCCEFDEYLTNYDRLHRLKNKFEYVCDFSGIDVSTIEDKIEKLPIGAAVGFFLQKQNASIDFTKICKDKVVISLYYIAAPLFDIYPDYPGSKSSFKKDENEENKNGSYTLTTVSPIKRVVVPIDSITPLWIQQLYALATNEMHGSLPSSMSQDVKKHVNEVVNPKYVTEWLIGTLESVTDLSDMMNPMEDNDSKEKPSGPVSGYDGDDEQDSKMSEIAVDVVSGVSQVMVSDVSQVMMSEISGEASQVNWHEMNRNLFDRMVVNRKKIRDCAVLTDDGPWRRSGAWFGLKQSLDSHYHDVYKLIIVHFMAIYLRKYAKQLNAEQKHEAIVKIQRRMKKITDGYKRNNLGNNNNNNNNNMQRQIFSDCETITKNVFDKMNQEWEKRMKSEHTHLEWKRVTGPELLEHKYPFALLKKELIDIVKNDDDSKHGDKYDYKQNVKWHAKWKEKRKEFVHDDQLLIDFENDILEEGMRLLLMIDKDGNDKLKSKLFDNYYQLHDYFKLYAQHASQKYEKGNAYYFSRLLLTSLNVLVIFHIANSIEYSQQYSFDKYRFPEFIEPLFNNLLLNTKDEVKNATMMKSYIGKFVQQKELEDVDSAAAAVTMVIAPSTFKQQTPVLNKDSFNEKPCVFGNMSFMDSCKSDVSNFSPNKSFDIMFAENNEAMKHWIKRLNDAYEKWKVEREEEIKIAKEKHQQLQQEIKKLQERKKCDCYFQEDEETRERVKITCKRCTNIKLKQADADGLELPILEKPLPDDKNAQFSVAFEACMPDEFIMLRNVVLTIQHLTFEDDNNPTQKDQEKEKHTRKRKRRRKISKRRQWRVLLKQRFGKRCIRKSKLSCENNLFSTNVWAMFSYGSKQHCTKKIDSFFVDCRCDVRCPPLMYISSKCLLPDITSYQLKELDLSNYSEIDIASYKSMQEFLSESDGLTQNDVLCKQDICPSDMSLNNFISFASMKRNSNLILNRILLDITQKKLKWNSQQNVLLILQSLWQGLPDNGNNSSEFVNNSQFCNLLLREIDKYMDSIDDNWEQHYTLLCLIFILRRFVDFSHFYYDNGLKLMIKAREICIKWIEMIEIDLSETQTKIKDAGEKSVGNLRKLLVLLNIIQRLTFFHFGSELESMAKQFKSKIIEDRLLDWLICMNNIWENYRCVKDDYFIENLLAICKIDMGNLVGNVLLKYMVFNQNVVLNRFLNHKWKRNDKKYNFKRIDKSSQFVFEDNGVTLQVDIETGLFLVNGTSVSRLPPKILENSDFLDLFPDVILEVIPLPKNNTYQTKYKFKGYYFIFEYVEESDRVIIKQFRENSKNGFDEYIFVSKQYIKNLTDITLPLLMISLHWHWLDMKKNCIQFRDKKYVFNPLSNQCVKYIWHEKLNMIERLADGCFLINTNDSYKDLIDFFKRLEESQHIYVWQKLPLDGLNVNRNNHHIYCELPRFNLTFELKSNKVLHCKEYNMTVDTNQGLNTLVGLQSKLVLEYTNTLQHARRVVIVPYGDIECEKDESDGDHHKTIVRQLDDGEEIRICYSFEIDSTLKCLRASDTIDGWCYLALLHARTSYVLCDAFTKMTGVESSVHWLENQCMPFGTKFNMKALDILDQIASISPLRRYKDAEIDLPVEKVTYIDTMSVYAQFDGYLLLINKIEPIVKPDTLDDLPSRTNNFGLARIEYVRNSQLYSNICVNSLILDDGWKNNSCNKPIANGNGGGINRNVELKFEANNVIKSNFSSNNICNDVSDFAHVKLKSESAALADLRLDNFNFCDVNDWDDIDVLEDWCALYRIAQSNDGKLHQRLKMFISYKLFENGTKLDEKDVAERRNLLWRLIYVCDNWRTFSDIRMPWPQDIETSDNWFEDVQFDDNKIDEFCKMINDDIQPLAPKFSETDSTEFKQRENAIFDEKKTRHDEMMSMIRIGFYILQSFLDNGDLNAITQFTSKDREKDKIFERYIPNIVKIYYNSLLLKHFKEVNDQFGSNRIRNVWYNQISRISKHDALVMTRYCLSDHMSIDDKCLVSLGLSVRYHESMKLDDIQSLLFVQKELSVKTTLDENIEK